MNQHATKSPRETPGLQTRSIAWWREAHRLLLVLCDDLEAIADSLPRHVIPQDCIFAAKNLDKLIRDVHTYEEQTLFPALQARFLGSPEMTSAIERLRFEHVADECYADDLAEKLLDLANGGQDVNIEALAYMLRGFFEALRRHIAYERDHFSGVLEALQPTLKGDPRPYLN
jgi:hemerythrin-like domain-containing protein